MNLLILTQKADKNDPILGFFHAWIVRLAERFHAVTVICLEEGSHDFPANVRVISLGKEAVIRDANRDPKFSLRIKYSWRFLKYIIRERKNYDAVFAHMNPEYIVLGGPIFKMLSKPIFLWYTHKSVNMRLRIAELFCKKIFTASKESFRLPSIKVIVMGHGIDVDLFGPKIRNDRNGSGISNDKKQVNGEQTSLQIITVGRISPVKDYETIFEAVKIASQALPGTTIGVVGEPISREDYSYLNILNQKYGDLISRGIVFLKGAIVPEKVPELLSNSDVFISASQTGSLDKAPLEAMASGVIALGSNDALKPILQPFGLYFTPGNAKELADKILKVHKMNNRLDLGMKLRENVVKNNSLESLIRKLAEEIKNAK